MFYPPSHHLSIFFVQAPCKISRVEDLKKYEMRSTPTITKHQYGKNTKYS